LANQQIRPRSYSCSRLGRTVTVKDTYTVETDPPDERFVEFHCSGMLECGIAKGQGDHIGPFDWSLCPLYLELYRRGLVKAPPEV